MKDLSRERLAELRRECRFAPIRREMTHVPVPREELLALLDMASRAVSEETVRKLAEYDAAPLTGDETRRAAGEFAMAAARDLRPSAEALARSAVEGKDG